MNLDVSGNFLRGVQGGMQLGQQVQQTNDRNALRAIGPGIMAGDPAAMEQFAAIDPIGAFNLARQREQDEMRRAEFGMNMQLSEARLGQIKEASAQAAREQAAALSQEERAAEAAKIDSGLAAASAAYQMGPEAFNAWVQGNAASIQEDGIDPSQMTYDSFPMFAAGLVGAREGIMGGVEFAKGLRPTPQAPMSPQGKLMADLQAGRITQEQFDAATAPSGMFIQSDGEGGFILEQGRGVISGQPALEGSAQPQTPIEQRPVGNESFGLEGAAKSVANTVADAVTGREAFPEAGEQLRLFRDLETDLLQAIAGAFDRQPATKYLDLIRATLPQAGNPLQGPSSARQRLAQLKQRFADDIAVLQQQSQGGNRKDVRELRNQALALQKVIRRIERAEQSLSDPGAANQTSSGVQWRIEP